jgi:hypothetical protein
MYADEGQARWTQERDTGNIPLIQILNSAITDRLGSGRGVAAGETAAAALTSA